MSIQVIKRSGIRQEIDIQKIQKQTHDACKGLSGTSQSELELDAQIQFNDGISTVEIQQTLIRTAADKIQVDAPNWTFVASRLFLYDLYHRVSGFTGYRHIDEYFKKGYEEGRILQGFKERYDLDRINSAIVPERDLQFTYLGIKTLYDRYLLKDKKSEVIELPQHMFMAIAMFLAQNESDPTRYAIEFYDVISKFEVMLATPTLANARTPRHQLSSCYIGSTPDNIEGIFDAYKDMALLSKYGGGIGWDFSKVRAIGSFIDGHKNAAGGVIPFLKIVNDVAIAVDQLGTRKGAIATYLEVWHPDILDFIDLRKNSGEERRRGHDLFPAVWLCDLFMQRVKDGAKWTLFDPFLCPRLMDTYGEEFEALYLGYEADPNSQGYVMEARELWKKILTSYFETGMPFLGFKDNANRANPNGHAGIIRSSNLCTEIFQNTAPAKFIVDVEFDDGSHATFDELESVTTDAGITKKANKLSSIDRLKGRRIFHATREGVDEEVAVCNLASINLSKINTPSDIARVVPIAVRMLDSVIDLNFYPIRSVKVTNQKTRAIGLGVMGEAEMLAIEALHFGSEDHLLRIDEVMENISYNAIKSSMLLAKEKGRYKAFEGSNWSRGIFPIDVANTRAKELVARNELFKENDWEALRADVKKHGMRNGYLISVAPTSSISILCGTTQTIEPVYKKRWVEENLSGVIPTVVPKLDLNTWEYYTSAYEVAQTDIIKAGAVRQKWIDQGQSLNLFFKVGVGGRELSDIYLLAWELGLKSTYYLRSQSPDADTIHDGTDLAIDRSIECEGCQ